MKKFYLLFFALLALATNPCSANVTVTAPSLTVSGCPFPTAYFTLGNIVITEGSKGDIANGTNVTLILSAPANFEFQAGIGTASDNAQNVTVNGITVTATTITLTITVNGTN